MKFPAIFLALYLIFPVSAFTQGTSCTSPVTISMDGVLRSYTSSSATGSNVLCTNNGITPVTWFRITTNALAECPLLNITVSDSLACEVAFYTSCSSMLSSSSMCFYGGYGLWAPNENFLAAPNTTYYLRVKTSTACTIRIAGQNFTPPNDDCPGALSITTSLLNDNNSCDHGDVSIPPSNLCALTLENTAWYQFYVAITGYSIITISNIHCDNGAANNNSGFQIGFFKGSCASLEWMNCVNGSGATVQATTQLLTAGTQVFVAIDGISGANCSYSINGVNVTGVLSGSLKYFSGWKSAQSNILQWTVLREAEGHYIIERALNGVDFNAIGRIENKVNGNGTVVYNFEDETPPNKAFYRLKQISISGKISFSNIIQISRAGLNTMQVNINNPAGHLLTLNIATNYPGQNQYAIINTQGQTISSNSKNLIKGNNQFSIDISTLPAGQYCFVIFNDKEKVNKMFFKN